MWLSRRLGLATFLFYGEPLQSTAFCVRCPLHLLIHPIWWNEWVGMPEQVLYHFVARRSQHLAASVAAASTVYRTRTL